MLVETDHTARHAPGDDHFRGWHSALGIGALECSGECRPYRAGRQSSTAQRCPCRPSGEVRADAATVPVETLKLRDNMYLLSGPGGNIVVLNGPDGKLLVDTFVSTGWTK